MEPGLDISIRLENPADTGMHRVVHAIHEAAFGGSEEAGLVDSLRHSSYALLSLVAESPEGIVGHILFTRMWIETASGQLPAAALAPVAVIPPYQCQGIGRRLIQHGLAILKERGEPIVIVVGHPSYYPRFGFSSKAAEPLASPFPREAFMALELIPGALSGVEGYVVYAPPFGIPPGPPPSA